MMIGDDDERSGADDGCPEDDSTASCTHPDCRLVNSRCRTFSSKEMDPRIVVVCLDCGNVRDRLGPEGQSVWTEYS